MARVPKRFELVRKIDCPFSGLHAEIRRNKGYAVLTVVVFGPGGLLCDLLLPDQDEQGAIRLAVLALAETLEDRVNNALDDLGQLSTEFPGTVNVIDRSHIRVTPKSNGG